MGQEYSKGCLKWYVVVSFGIGLKALHNRMDRMIVANVKDWTFPLIFIVELVQIGAQLSDYSCQANQRLLALE
jgi:hypothetical protein